MKRWKLILRLFLCLGVIAGMGLAGCGDEDDDLCLDYDNDGYGAPGSDACPNEETDCNDGSAGIYPGAPETCNGIDSNCDGRVC